MNNKGQFPAININPEKYISGHSVDCVIIGYNEEGVHVLVMKWKGIDMWSLPGGFIYQQEGMNEAAVRILSERTGLHLAFLQQFYTFGDFNRRKADTWINEALIKSFGNSPMINWLKERFISTGYLSLVNMDNCELTPDLYSEVCEWKTISLLPDLIFDHNKIVNKALDHIRNQINYLPIGISLLPQKFTMKELRKLYESILNKSLDRANFQKKILKLGILTRHEKHHTGGAYKAPYLYSFNQNEYDRQLENGICLF